MNVTPLAVEPPTPPVRSAPTPVDETIDADTTLTYADPPGRRWLVRVSAVISLVVYASYLVYRALFTINPDALTFSLVVYFAELHGFFALAFFFHEVWSVRRRRVVAPPSQVSVDVFVTTFNEDEELVRQTLRAAVAMRYPHTTYVLDDGRRSSVRALAEELGCRYLTRSDNAHAKAGNWNNAFRQTSADLIATFDADHVPRPDFLERTLGFFRDPKVALVQVPQQYHNLDSVQHHVSWRTKRAYNDQDSFFNLVMPGKDNWNSAYFCGTGAVLRRTSLEPHGGILTGTITEDLHTSIVLHASGWKSVYLNEVLVTGLAPVDLDSLAKQRLRWAEGNLKVATIVNPLTTPGLTLKQRLSYAGTLYYWTIGAPKLIYYLAPPWMLITGTFPIAHYDRQFLAIYLGMLATLIGAFVIGSRGKGRLLMEELFSMVSFFTLLRAMKRVIVGRHKPGLFEVTNKRGSGRRDFLPVMPHLALLLTSLLAITWSLMGLGFGVSDDAFGAGTAIFWTLYNMALMTAVLRISARPVETRGGTRFRANFACERIDGTRGPSMLGVTADISEHDCSLLWPEELHLGDRLPLRLHFGPQIRDWRGEIISVAGRQSDGWHRYGVRFLDLSPADVDLINDSVFTLVVPELFATLTQPGWIGRAWRQVRIWRERRAVRRTGGTRQSVRLPLRLTHGTKRIVATARDLSTSGISVVTSDPLAAGSVLTLEMSIPGRTLSATVSVARCVPQPSRIGFDTWLIGLRFEDTPDAAALNDFRRWDAA